MKIRAVKLLFGFLALFLAGFPGMVVFLILFLEPQIERATDYFFPRTAPPSSDNDIRIEQLSLEVDRLKEKVNSEVLRKTTVRGL